MDHISYRDNTFLDDCHLNKIFHACKSCAELFQQYAAYVRKSFCWTNYRHFFCDTCGHMVLIKKIPHLKMKDTRCLEVIRTPSLLSWAEIFFSKGLPFPSGVYPEVKVTVESFEETTKGKIACNSCLNRFDMMKKFMLSEHFTGHTHFEHCEDCNMYDFYELVPNQETLMYTKCPSLAGLASMCRLTNTYLPEKNVYCPYPPVTSSSSNSSSLSSLSLSEHETYV